MTKKILLPQIISTKTQLNQVVEQRSWLVHARKSLEKNLRMHAGECTDARITAMEKEIEEYTKRIKTYNYPFEIFRQPTLIEAVGSPQPPNGSEAPAGGEGASLTASRHRRNFKLDAVRQFGSYLVQTRVRRGLKRVDLARRIGISNAQLGRHEQSLYAKANYALMVRIAEELERL